MKVIKWKSLVITCIVCLLPILLGIALWEELPEVLAIHFDINNNPDNFASKGFAVFGLPGLMVIFQIICCIASDISAQKHSGGKKLERIAKWIIPIITVILYIMTLGYSLGWNIDIRKVCVLIVGGIFLVMGNYLPKLDYIKNYNISSEKARKINRFMGFGMVIMGILMLISLLLPPIATVICLLLLIPYIVVSVVYGIKVGRSK